MHGRQAGVRKPPPKQCQRIAIDNYAVGSHLPGQTGSRVTGVFIADFNTEKIVRRANLRGRFQKQPLAAPHFYFQRLQLFKQSCLIEREGQSGGLAKVSRKIMSTSAIDTAMPRSASEVTP